MRFEFLLAEPPIESLSRAHHIMKRNASLDTGEETAGSETTNERHIPMGRLAHDIHPAFHPHRFMVGHDAQGHWVVSDELGMVGGIFADRESAVRFALAESDHVPGAVFCAPSDLTLTLGPVLSA